MSYIWNHSVLITGTPNGLNGKLGQTQTFNQPPEDKQEEKKKIPSSSNDLFLKNLSWKYIHTYIGFQQCNTHTQNARK